MPPSELKRLALLIAVNCVRNTVIENYHSDEKLSDPEMMAFNQDVANKIYTFLHYMFNKPQEDQEAILSAMGMMYPSNWDQPKLDADFVKAINFFKRAGNRIEQTSSHRPRPRASTSPKGAAKRKKR
jgi:hypothetical protein